MPNLILPKDIETKTDVIQLKITEDHHRNFDYWKNFRGAELLHVDAHSDMDDGASPSENPSSDDRGMDINRFICPALYYGFVSSVYWLNPQIEKRYQDIGSTCFEEGRNHLKFSVKKYFLSGKQIISDPPRFPKPISREVLINRLKTDSRSLILDIDLDAFCCDGLIENPPRVEYGNIEGYEQRIEDTKSLLKEIRFPKLITITRSQGDKKWVPRYLVNKVQAKTLQMLSEVYSK